MKRIDDIERVIGEIKLHIKDYLALHGLRPNRSGKYKCPFPSHNGGDSHPSANIAPSGVVLHCFGCGCSGDIFNLAHILDGMEISGTGFYDTVRKLADMFSIQYTEIDGVETYSDVLKQTWTTVISIIKNVISDEALAIIDSRGWKRSTIAEFQVGTVSKRSGFIRECERLGINAKMLQEIGLYHPRESFQRIHKDRIYFPIMNDRGDPVALGIMNTRVDPSRPETAWKYVNTATTQVYNKERVLYGFNIARMQGSNPIYVVEGYGDVIALHGAGIKNSCALCGTAFTEGHAKLLTRYRIRDVVLALDGDDAGRVNTERAIREFGHGFGIKIQVKAMPHGKDPDDVIHSGGREAFMLLPVVSSTEWLINYYRSIGNDEHKVAKQVCEIIASEPDHIERDKLCFIISKETGLPLKVVRATVDDHRDVEAKKVREKVRQETAKLVAKVQKETHIDSIVDMLRETTSKINRLQQLTADEHRVNERDTIIAMIREEETKREELDGATTGIRWLDNALDGFPIDGDHGMVVIGGKPNSGKSSFMINIARQLLTLNQNNIIFYQTIDDTQKVLYNRWCASSSGLPVNAVRNPNKYRASRKLLSSLGITREEFDHRRVSGYEELIEIVEAGRLLVRDQTSIPSIGYARGILENLRDEHPDAAIYYFLDAFNNLADVSGVDNQRRLSVEEACNELKRINHQLDIPTVYTSHYRKVDHMVRPTNDDLKESGILYYHPVVTMHVWNPLSEDPNHNRLIWRRDYSISESINEVVEDDIDGDFLPVLEINVGKNKKSDFKGFCYMNFEPSCIRMYEPTPGEVNRYKEISRKIGYPSRRF